jgi:chromosome segregation ATPase
MVSRRGAVDTCPVAEMRDNPAVVDDQAEETARPRRGRPRKWPTEAARREHEAAKRRLRNKTTTTHEEFDDIVRLTALADDLQRRLDVAAKEVEQLRQRTLALEHRLAEAARRGRASSQPSTRASVPPPPPVMNRQQRREAERVQRRAAGQQPRTPPPI